MRTDRSCLKRLMLKNVKLFECHIGLHLAMLVVPFSKYINSSLRIMAKFPLYNLAHNQKEMRLKQCDTNGMNGNARQKKIYYATNKSHARGLFM